MNTKPNQAARLRCESLEDRSNPAGNVAVWVDSGIVVAAGDAADNSIFVQHTINGDVFVHGTAGTLVNGQSSVYLGRGIPNGLIVDLGAGNDRIDVLGFVTGGGVWLAGNVGNDVTTVNSVSAASVVVSAGDGNDNTYVTHVWTNQLWLDGGPGIDAVHLDTAFVPPGGLLIVNSEIPY